MGANSLTARSGGQTVEADDVNQYRNAFIGDLVPRNAAGAAEDEQASLGTASLQFSNLYISGQIVQGGSVLDFTQLVGEGHRILSGEASNSGYPEFLTFIGSTTTGRIFASNTDLVAVINTASVTLSSNIDITGLSVAPSSNNTCLINDASLSGLAATKVFGERGEPLTVDSIGSEISSLNGTVQAFKKGSEYFFAYIDSSNNRLFPFKRGIASSDREALSDNDTITLLQANYIFLDADGLNTYTTTLYPTFEPSDPSGTTNQWYFDTTNKRWRRYSGSWANINAHFLGTVISDDTACVAADPADFSLSWGSQNEGQLYKVDDSKIRVDVKAINVAGVNHIDNKYGQVIDLSVSGDRESGVTESSSTRYYIYADKNLKFRFSDKAPRPFDSRLGQYHPSEYWRYVGYVDNDSSSNLEDPFWDNGRITEPPAPKKFIEGLPPSYTTASTITLPVGMRAMDSEGEHVIEISDSDIVLDITASGLNGLDSGSEANNTWYYVYLIGKTDGTVGALLSTTNEADSGSITLPTGYTLKRQLPIAIRNDGSGDIIPFYCPRQGEVRYQNQVTHNNGSIQTGGNNILSAGTATTATSVSASSFIPAISRYGLFNHLGTGSLGTALAEAGLGVVTNAIRADASAFQVTQVWVKTNTSQEIEYRRTGGSGSIYLDAIGYKVTEISY